MRHRSGEAGTVVPVSNSIESKYFLAVWACYTARKSKCQSAKKTKKRRKYRKGSDTKMPDEKGNRTKAKNMMYMQQLKHLPTETIDNLIIEVEKTNPKKYALIVHDKDKDEQGEPVEEHVHLMISYENGRSVKNTAKKLKDKPQYIQIWNGKAENGYSYLIHATKDSITKYQYSPSEVRANFNYQEEIRRITEKVEKSRQLKNSELLLDALYKGEITKEEIEKSLSGSQYGRMKRQIEDVWSKHLQFKAKEWREEMKKSGKQIEVIWISGKSGTGKTSLAKAYAEKLNRPYFITGSSRDIFQNYSGEHTMIIDEFRVNMIQYPDLLRILDPFGSQVMAPSRYSDKALSCDLIIITSPYSPVAFYNKLFAKEFENTIDSLEQLLRRITLTIEMDDSHIKAVEYDNEVCRYNVIDGATEKNIYSKNSRTENCINNNPKDLFDSMIKS